MPGPRGAFAPARPHRHPLPAPPDTVRPELAWARDVRARELVAGTPVAGIAAAIMAECGPVHGTTWIRAFRLALGIALADVVAQVRAQYLAEGRRAPRFSETLLSAYEGGQKRPGPEYLHYLGLVYRADPEDLGLPGPCLCGRPHTAAALDGAANDGAALDGATTDGASTNGTAIGRAAAGAPGPVSAPGSRAAECVPVNGEQSATGDGDGQGDGNGNDAAVRRMLVALMADAGAPVDGDFLGAVEQARRGMDAALLRGTVSAAMVDQWEQTTAGYGRRYMTVPPLRLLCDVLLDFGDVRRTCAERQPLDFAERLCRLAGQLAGLAGILLLDLGDQRLARSFFRTARAAADETGDRRLRAWVAVREALVPLYYGDPAEAAGLATAAAGLAGRRPCVAGVMAPVIEARAQARLARRAGQSGSGQGGSGQGGSGQGGRGRREELDRARAALDRALSGLTDLPAHETGDTAFGYTERQYFFHAGDALAVLGDHQEAQRAFGQALARYPAAEVTDRALVTLGQAQCLTGAGEPEQALATGRDALLGLPAGQRPEIVLQAARALGAATAARAPGLPVLAEYARALAGAAGSGATGPGPCTRPGTSAGRCSAPPSG
jgi:tetratricopeptide (TPR) repeat protein